MSATMILSGLGWSNKQILSDSVVSHLGVKCVGDCLKIDLNQLGILEEELDAPKVLMSIPMSKEFEVFFLDPSPNCFA